MIVVPMPTPGGDGFALAFGLFFFLLIVVAVLVALEVAGRQHKMDAKAYPFPPAPQGWNWAIVKLTHGYEVQLVAIRQRGLSYYYWIERPTGKQIHRAADRCMELYREDAL